MLISSFEGKAKQYLEDVSIFTGPVAAQTEFSLDIPLKVRLSALKGCENDPNSFEATFWLVNHKGKYFGEKISVKAKLPVGEAEFYQRAVHL